MRVTAGLAALLVLLISPATAALAQDTEPMLLSPTAQLDALAVELNDEQLSAADAERIARAASSVRADATGCVDDSETKIRRLESNLLILGDALEAPQPQQSDDAPDTSPLAGEPDEVSEQRTAFEREVAELRNRIAGCKLLQLRARQISDTALERLSAILAQRLSSHGPPTLEVLRNNLAHPLGALRSLAAHLLTPARLGALSAADSALIALVAALAFGIGTGCARLAEGWTEARRGRGGRPAIEVVYARAAAPWLPITLCAIAAAATYRLILGEVASELPLPRLFLALGLFGVAGALSHWSVGPYSPGAKLGEDANHADILRRRFLAVCGAVALMYVAFGRTWFASPPPQNGLLLRGALTVFTATSILWLARSPRLIAPLAGRAWLLRAALGLAALALVVAELLGYRNLANHLMRAALGTLAAGAFLWVLLWLIRAAVEGIVTGKTDLSYRVRAWLGMRPNDNSPELSWLRLILSAALWVAFGVCLISLWDSTGSALPKLTEMVTQGIKLSDQYTLVPGDVLRGLLVFGLVIALTAWIKAQLTKRWLRDIGMDRGSREALVTLGGYVGFVLALILGLALSGVNLRGFAIVLGALGVGIGFGLQNIVNNFVSGLILLFERPIKSGDFVSVGDVEGVVTRIRIRSTEIESLDRRNIIVPNSELIATQVTNWVLHDPFGRLTLKIGVAYGSDTERVRDLLEEIPAEHPEVITKGPAPGPRALFMGFGDSALDFELRVWIRNIEKRFGVTSDLNFAIDRAFRAAGIEIPFPQRDLHLRSWSPGATPTGADTDEDAVPDDNNDAPR